MATRHLRPWIHAFTPTHETTHALKGEKITITKSPINLKLTKDYKDYGKE
jgi:hypothetical protein